MLLRISFLALSAVSALRRAGVGLVDSADLSYSASAEAERAEAERAELWFLQSLWGSLVRELEALQGTALPELKNRTDAIVASKIGAVDAASQNLSGRAMLMPALSMLTGMYDEQKERIGEINKQEKKSKDRFTQQHRHHEEVLAHYKDLLAHHKISQGLYENVTKEENHIYSYWARCRDRAHHVFHTQLKLTHGLMSKEKGMISAYDKALSEPSSTKEGAEQLAKAQVPEVVLLQGQELAEYCQEALSTAKAEMASLDAARSSK